MTIRDRFTYVEAHEEESPTPYGILRLVGRMRLEDAIELARVIDAGRRGERRRSERALDGVALVKTADRYIAKQDEFRSMRVKLAAKKAEEKAA